MNPHPDFAELDVPQSFTLGALRLDILTAQDVEEDFEAVTSSADVLRGIFGGVWPDGLTLAANETDLHWHQREFMARRSFAWIIRDDASDAYLGCAYVYPDIGHCGRGVATVWIRDCPDRVALQQTASDAFFDWVRGLLPADYQLDTQQPPTG